MKLTHFFRYLKFALFLAILCSFSFAYAYDFQVNGIYYNKTSANTVEVTYKDSNYGSYSGEVIIPSTVSFNNRTYTVTAIGDSAFYASYYVTSVTIPESVTSIGEASFLEFSNKNITCLSNIPPSLNNSFFSYGYAYSALDYIGNTYGEGVPGSVLWVPLDALDNYMNSSWNNYFLICYIGAGATASPTIVMQEYESGGYIRSASASIYGEGTIYSYYQILGKTGGINIWTPWEESSYVSYSGIENDPLSISYLAVYAFAYEYGKLPSVVVSDVSEAIYSYVDYPDPYGSDGPELVEIWEEDVSYYDFIVDGVCYRHLGDNKVAVAHDSKVHLEWLMWRGYLWDGNYYEIYSIGENSYCEPTSRYYNELVKLPQTVEYNGIIYDVTSIVDYTFSYCFYEDGIDFQYWDYDSDMGRYDIFSAVYWLLIGGCPPKILTLPTSLEYIESRAFGNNRFFDSSTFIITGEGAWSAGALNVAVQRLDIASGITAIPGLQVNPREVYCYAKVPPTCDENTFTDYTGTLHVPQSSLAAYFTAPYWCNFANIVGDAVELTDLILNKNSAEMLVGEQLTLNATIQPSNANIDSIEWSSSNEDIATVVNGVVTAKALGECDIIVTCLDKRAICHVKVVEQIVTITLDQHRASLLPNHILTLTPTVTPVATDLVVTSSNPAVAAARLANGKVQVVGVSVGTAIIKVASADGNAVADSCIVNVYTEAGDVDGDGFVKIDDVTSLIDYLLGSNPSIDMGNADINYDGNVNIADVTALIDLLLNGNTGIPSRETFTVNGISFTMIRVPAGTFMMGATEEQGDDAYNWERPVHEVTFSSSYMIGETEVTQELWLAVMGTNPSKHEGSLQKPVENVTWPDCQEFIARLNQLTGLSFRLPTEAEWEYAARGGNRSHGYKYAGSDNIADVGNISSSTTLPVGSLQPNELYLYDMSGNVDEWVSDYWGNYTSGPQTDPTGPETGSDHVYRSGSWYSGADVARVSYRFFRSNTFQRGTLGLRLAL